MSPSPPPRSDVPTAQLSDWRHFAPLALSPILSAALKQIVEHGYDATSVRSIANDVGVTVPALYYHFENKQAILVALLDAAMTTVETHVAAALADVDQDPVMRFQAIVESVTLYMAHHRDLAFLDSERRSLTPANFARYAARRDALEKQLFRVIRDGQSAGVFAADDARECSRAIFSMCQGVAQWFKPGGARSPRQTARRYVRLGLAMVEHQAPRASQR